MIPSANILKRIKAPPENILNSPTILFCWELKSSCSLIGFKPGTGIYEPTRNITIASNTKRSRYFKSANPLDLRFAPSLPVAIFMPRLFLLPLQLPCEHQQILKDHE